MSNEILYPQTLDNLFKKLQYILKNEQDEKKIKEINDWISWFNSTKYELKYVFSDNEYLKAYYYKKGKYSLQIWKHNSDVDAIQFNLFSNYYSEYDNNLTEVLDED